MTEPRTPGDERVNESYCHESKCRSDYPECGLNPEKCRERDRKIKESSRK